MQAIPADTLQNRLTLRISRIDSAYGAVYAG